MLSVDVHGPVPLDGAPAAPRVPSFFGMSRPALAERLQGLGLPAYRAAQLYSWIYRKHQRDPVAMTNLPRSLRPRLSEVCALELPRTASVLRSADELTHKFVLALADGARVECVSMRGERRLTYCISSQAGCALACAFCATGRMGLKRNLEAQEIVAQVFIMQEWNGWRDARFNLVFMGM